MHPVLTVLRLGAAVRPIGSYGAMVALGLFIASALAVRASARAKLDIGATFVVLACMVAGGFASAALTFVVVELIRSGELHLGGLVVYGALPGALAAMIGAGRWRRLPVWRALDLAIPGVAAGHALGRLGCLLGGCCYGAPSALPWAIVYLDPLAPAAHPSIARHPSPLYEALGQLVLALVFALVPPREPGTGRRAATYLGAYAILRFGVELTRGDSVRGVMLGVSTSEAVSITVLAAVLLFLLVAPRLRA